MYFLTFSDQNYFFAKTAGKSSQLRIIQNSLGARKEASRGRVLKHQVGTLSANTSEGRLLLGGGSLVAPRSCKKCPIWPTPRGPRGHGRPFLFRARLGLYWDHHQNNEPRDDRPIPLLRPVAPAQHKGHSTAAARAWQDRAQSARREQPRFWAQMAEGALGNGERSHAVVICCF